jgi:hypothetical protein
VIHLVATLREEFFEDNPYRRNQRTANKITSGGIGIQRGPRASSQRM